MSLKKYLILNKMVSNYTLGLLVNVILHVLILFIFLTILFFTVIAKKEKEETNSRLKSAIKTGVDTLLSSCTPWVKSPEEWDALANDMKKIEQENEKPDEELENNNTKIFYNVMIIIIMFTVIISFYLLYIIGIKKRKIGFKYIMTENACIFIILGSLEFIFFWYIIQHYIPIYSEDVEIEILKHIKSYF